MISAKEASIESYNNRKKKLDDEMARVESAIKNSIKKGKNSCTIGIPLSDETIEEISNKGFAIHSSNYGNELNYRIDW